MESFPLPDRENIGNYSPWLSLATRFTALAMASLALALLCWFVLLWFRLHPHMPWRDALPLLRDLMPLLNGEWSSEALQAQLQPHYTAHRLVVLRALLFLDMSYFSGTGHVLYATSWLSVASMLGLYSLGAWQHFGRNKALLCFSVATATLLAFSTPHLWNFLNPICSSWHLSIALSVLAFGILLRLPGKPSTTLILLAYCLILLAAFTNFSGVLAWLVLPGLLLLRRHRAWPIAALCSAVFVMAYMTGISSDARIALEMAQSLDSADVRAYEQQVEAAISANTPVQVLSKSLDLIGWPLSSSQPLLARLLALMSLAVLVGTGITSAQRWLHHEPELPAWTLWCAICALYCLGIIATVGFGRVLEYQDLLHGPSPERHQTFVVMYWLFICGVSTGYLRQLSLARQLAGMLTIAATVMALIFLAQRDTLKNEFISAEFAGYLFITGEQDALQAPTQSLGLHLTPHYALAFDNVFRQRQLAYHAPIALPEHTTHTSCPTILKIEQQPANALMRTAVEVTTPFQPLQIEWPDSRSMLAREMIIVRESKVEGRLMPAHRGDYHPRSMFELELNAWQGVISEPSVLNNAQLWLRSLTGWQLLCNI